VFRDDDDDDDDNNNNNNNNNNEGMEAYRGYFESICKTSTVNACPRKCKERPFFEQWTLSGRKIGTLLHGTA
jgi:hypothetical protein